MKMFIALIITLAMMASIVIPAGIGITVKAAGADENGKRVAQAIGDEGLVLLKNENKALPLQKGTSVALFGEGQYLRLYTEADFKTDEDTLKLMNSSTHATLGVQHGYVPWGAGSSRALGVEGVNGKIDPLDAFKQAAQNGEITLYEEISNGYVDALKNSHSDATYKEFVPTDADYKKASENADVAIVFIRRWDGECVDANVNTYWNLSANELAMLKNAEKYFKKVVVVLNTPAPIDTSWAKDEIEGISVDAVIFAGYGGMQGGLPIADVILGRVNPSGKLATTYTKKLEDYPTTESFIKDVNKQQYTEDIFLGYRYFETFDPEYKKVNYEFGFGLSYTQFDISFSDFKQEGTTVTVNANVKNIGDINGKEVVQIYLSAPQGVLGKAKKVLCAFEKTDVLEPGAVQSLSISFDLKDFASYDDLGKTGHKAAYVLEAGDYVVLGGNSVKNVKEAGKANVAELTVVEQLTNQTKTTLEKRLLADGSYEYLKSTPKPTATAAATATPTATPTAPANKVEEIFVEAEDFIRSSETSAGAIGIEGFSGYLYNSETEEWEDHSGDCIAHTYRGGEVYYEIDVPATDDYTFTALVAGHGSVKKPAKVTVLISQDDVTYTETGLTVTGGETWENSTYNSYEELTAEGKVRLEKGKVYVLLKLTNAPNVDYFTFTGATVKGTTKASVNEKEAQNTTQKTYKLYEVIKGTITLDEFVGMMTDEELAQFCVPHQGSKIGPDDATVEKYGLALAGPSDGPSGIGSKGTSFHCETTIACTFNKKLVEAFGIVMGKECYDNNVDIWLAPGMNLHRNPLLGRCSEYYSEDPFLSGVMATTTVKAAQSMGISTCIKHFVCNEKEKNKLACDSQVSERALREIYLKPFEMCVKEGGTNGVMSSYNLVNGVPASASKDLLTNILRNEWGFKGYVSGDWYNDKDHVEEINAGNTVREPASHADINVVLKAVKEGKISRETLENSAKAVLYTVIRSKSFYEFNRLFVCGDNHEIGADHRCVRCTAPDPARIANVTALVDELINNKIVLAGKKKGSSVITWTILGILGVTALGVGIPVVINKTKKSKKQEETK